MRSSIRRTAIFRLEQLVSRGAHYRFLVVLGVIGLMSVVGGLAVLMVGDAELSNPADATWWAFLRLSDTGYLGDDEGFVKRAISSVLTVLGSVVFLGAMVAILTQWLNATLGRLELGLTPIRVDGHVVIVGWTDRTGIICRDLFSSEGRLRRWLDLRGLKRLRVAVLSRSVGPARIQELSDALGDAGPASRVILRSGSPLSTAHLERVDVLHAGSVVIPGVEATSSSAEAQDDAVIKALCAVAASVPTSAEAPPCVCELFDVRKVPVARRAYPGPLEVVASDVIVGRLLAYDLDQPGIAAVCNELLTHGEGATFYIYDWSGAPSDFGTLCRSVEGGILLGVVHSDGAGFSCELCPRANAEVRDGDGLIVVAHAFASIGFGPARPEEDVAPLPLREPVAPGERLLVLGWSRRVPAMLEELDRMSDSPIEVTVLAAVPEGERGVADAAALQHVRVQHVEGDITLPVRVAAVEPRGFDRIAFVASDWARSEAAADARTVSAYHALGTVLEGSGEPAHMTIEVADPLNVEFFDAARAQTIVSAELLAHLLAQVVLRRELMVVVDDIFGAGPSTLAFVKIDDPSVSSFAAASARVAAAGAIAVGVRHGGRGGSISLAPLGDEPLDGSTAELVVLTRKEA